MFNIIKPLVLPFYSSCSSWWFSFQIHGPLYYLWTQELNFVHQSQCSLKGCFTVAFLFLLSVPVDLFHFLSVALRFPSPQAGIQQSIYAPPSLLCELQESGDWTGKCLPNPPHHGAGLARSARTGCFLLNKTASQNSNIRQGHSVTLLHQDKNKMTLTGSECRKNRPFMITHDQK